MNQRQADLADQRDARRVGWVAGYGLALTRRDNAPMVAGYFPWTSFVPGWVPDKRDHPITVEWQRGWDEGLVAGRATWPEELQREVR